MGALSADFYSPMQNIRASTGYIAATGTVIYAGGLVQLNASGLAIAAIANSPNQIVGRAAQSLAGTEAAGTVIQVEEGDIFLNNYASNAPAQTNVGAKVYAANDNEVTTVQGSTCAVAGILIESGVVGPFGTTGSKVRVTLEASR